MKKTLLVFYIMVGFLFTAMAQTIVVPHMQRDDFNKIRSWWYYRADYPRLIPSTTQVAPAVQSGYLYFILKDPQWGYYPMHNVAIETASEDSVDKIYARDDTVLMRIRARFLTEHQPGSRGWGFWYTESGMPTIVEQSWFMQSKRGPNMALPEDQGTWWQVQKVNGLTYSTSQKQDLDPALLTGWHTYEIRRYGMNRIEYYADNVLVMTVTDAIPEEPYDFHHWIDNQVYNPEDNPDAADPDSFLVATYQGFWTGQDEMVTDYVQIITGGEPVSYSEQPAGIMKVRDYPNEIASGNMDVLWKDISFSAEEGAGLVLITAKAEANLNYDTADKLKIVLDGNDFGFGGTNGWDGTVLNGATKTVVLNQTFTAGAHNLRLYSETTPILYDITVLNSQNGAVLVNQNVDETAPSGSNDYLWKTYNFEMTEAGEVAIYLTASADENPGWSFEGPDGGTPNVDDSRDDDLRIELDATDYGWKSAKSWYGNDLFGETKSVLIHDTLNAGNHQLRLYANNTPTLNRVLVFGGNFDASLPVELASFNVTAASKGNLLEWVTESEVENMGFNLYRAVSGDTLAPSRKSFVKLNAELIPGAGNSNTRHTYSYLDQNRTIGLTYWYLLEDVSYSGQIRTHSPIRIYNAVYTPGKFQLSQNYPNPFNPSTTIPFNLEKPARVKVEIINVQGQVVKTVTDRYYTSGEYTLTWDGTSDRGNLMGSGVYYYRLTAGNRIEIKKMILLR